MVVQTIPDSQLEHLNFIFKWGCDDSSRQSKYKQKFEGESDGHIFSDGNMFLAFCIPLQLISGNATSDDKIIYLQNLRLSSTRYCRPITFYFIKETTEDTLKLNERINKQIHDLRPYLCDINGKNVPVTNHLLFKMID